MELTLTTPALLFPALSLLLLAYTNRFLALANLVRTLKTQYEEKHNEHHMRQIENLRRRLVIVRNMQAVGIGSLFGCVLCMFLLYAGLTSAGKIVFGASLLALLVSLGLSLWEIQISVDALNIELDDLQHDEQQRLGRRHNSVQNTVRTQR
jgi:predicted phage tail protein